MYDFQTEDFISDLDNYTDMSHYGPAINEWMIDCFADGHCLTGPSDSVGSNEKLAQIVNGFTAANADWLK